MESILVSLIDVRMGITFWYRCRLKRVWQRRLTSPAICLPGFPLDIELISPIAAADFYANVRTNVSRFSLGLGTSTSPGTFRVSGARLRLLMVPASKTE